MQIRCVITRMFSFIAVFAVVVVLGASSPMQAETPGVAVHGSTSVQPDQALKTLLEGNTEYVAENFDRKNLGSKRRQEVAQGQHPLAIILGCSDSRVPPEAVFNRGLGDLFVVRSAGHVVDDFAIGSIEYAVEHLGAKLILVLGHRKCGAVGAAIKGGDDQGHIGRIVKAIEPAVELAKKKETGSKSGTLADDAMMENVRMVVERLKQSGPVLAKAFAEGQLKIAGGYYDLESGKVTVMPDQH